MNTRMPGVVTAQQKCATQGVSIKAYFSAHVLQIIRAPMRCRELVTGGMVALFQYSNATHLAVVQASDV